VLVPRAQDDDRATYAPKLSVESARISWAASAVMVARFIRGLDPRPGAWTELRGKRIKLFGARAAGSPPESAEPGEIVETDPALLVATGDDVLQVLDVQPEGKGRLAAADWVRGRGAHPRDRFR
jgi:methionyl-tRNA formyltransferase